MLSYWNRFTQMLKLTAIKDYPCGPFAMDLDSDSSIGQFFHSLSN